MLVTLRRARGKAGGRIISKENVRSRLLFLGVCYAFKLLSITGCVHENGYNKTAGSSCS